jgi:hypothetical protein
VNLDQYVGERLQVTDVDVLAFFFDRSLALRLVAAECKTAEGRSAPSTKDRLLWLAGVNHLVGADEGFLATARAARNGERRFAALLGLAVVDPRDLERRETILGVGDSVVATHSQEAIARAEEAAKVKDEELKRVYTFARSELWLVPPVTALKRALGACRVLGARYSTDLPDAERRVVEWLAAEVVAGVALALTRLAAESYRQPEDVFARHLTERLAEGLASYEAMREIAKEVDKYMLGVLRDSGVDETRAVAALGAMAPRAPGYTEPLLEVISRLAASPLTCATLPRTVDAAYAGSAADGEAGRLQRLVATFLERQGRLPVALLAPLRQREESAGVPKPAAVDSDVDDAVADGDSAAVDKLFEPGRR